MSTVWQIFEDQNIVYACTGSDFQLIARRLHKVTTVMHNAASSSPELPPRTATRYFATRRRFPLPVLRASQMQTGLEPEAVQLQLAGTQPKLTSLAEKAGCVCSGSALCYCSYTASAELGVQAGYAPAFLDCGQKKVFSAVEDDNQHHLHHRRASSFVPYMQLEAHSQSFKMISKLKQQLVILL